MHRTWGGIVAGALFVLPSLFILIALSWVYMAFGNVPVVAGMFYGIKPAVTAIVVFAAYRIGSRALKNGCAVGASPPRRSSRSSRFNVPFPLIVLAAGIDRLRRRPRRAGQVQGRRRPWPGGKAFGAGADRRRHADAGARALHAGRASPRCSLVGAAAVGCVAMAALIAAPTAGTRTLTQMGWFFTKAALLTFGGAYAVLPYVYQGARRALQLADRRRR